MLEKAPGITFAAIPVDGTALGLLRNAAGGQQGVGTLDDCWTRSTNAFIARRARAHERAMLNGPLNVARGSMMITLHPASRIAVVRFAADTGLTGEHGAALVDAMRSVVGANGEIFALLADAAGISATDADYRATTGEFFAQHRAAARIAVINMRPIIRIVAEMFRVGVGIHLRTFSEETAARAWLRTQGVAA